MKVFKFSFLLLLVLSMFSCEEDDPCDGISCFNGGVCVNGLCECPVGFGGADCAIPQTPTTMTITKIDLLDYPVTDSSGGGWDLTSGADPFITFSQGTSPEANDYITGYAENVTGAALSYDITPAYNTTSLSSNWTIAVYDYDSTDADDFMGGIYFVPLNEAAGFPADFTLTTNSISFRLHVSWGF